MTRALKHPVLPGGLSQKDHDRIHELADLGWSSSRIAREISKHPSTVMWFLYSKGLRSPKARDTPRSILRNGSPLHRYTREEDAFISALRVQGQTFKAIADLATKRFGHLRKAHGIACRLIMIAGCEDAA